MAGQLSDFNTGDKPPYVTTDWDPTQWENAAQAVPGGPIVPAPEQKSVRFTGTDGAFVRRNPGANPVAVGTFEYRFPGMRKADSFVVYPRSGKDEPITVQGHRTIARFDPKTGKGLLNYKGSGSKYFVHLSPAMGAQVVQFPQDFINAAKEHMPSSGDYMGGGGVRIANPKGAKRNPGHTPDGFRITRQRPEDAPRSSAAHPGDGAGFGAPTSPTGNKSAGRGDASRGPSPRTTAPAGPRSSPQHPGSGGAMETFTGNHSAGGGDVSRNPSTTIHPKPASQAATGAAPQAPPARTRSTPQRPGGGAGFKDIPSFRQRSNANAPGRDRADANIESTLAMAEENSSTGPLLANPGNYTTKPNGYRYQIMRGGRQGWLLVWMSPTMGAPSFQDHPTRKAAKEAADRLGTSSRRGRSSNPQSEEEKQRRSARRMGRGTKHPRRNPDGDNLVSGRCPSCGATNQMERGVVGGDCGNCGAPLLVG